MNTFDGEDYVYQTAAEEDAHIDGYSHGYKDGFEAAVKVYGIIAFAFIMDTTPAETTIADSKEIFDRFWPRWVQRCSDSFTEHVEKENTIVAFMNSLEGNVQSGENTA